MTCRGAPWLVAISAALALSACSGTPATTLPPATGASGPGPATTVSLEPAHIMVLVLENREDSDVLGSPDAPYLNSLAARYGVATESFGRTHPSLPNYLDLISGSTWGVTSDCTGCSVDGPTLVDQLQARGISWKAYMQGAPTPCYQQATSGAGFAKRHDPFVYFRHIVSDPSLCDRVVPYPELDLDLAGGAAPDFVWVTPDVCDDGHDCSTRTMDQWVRQALGPVLASAWFRDHGRIVITFDEGDTNDGCCRVAGGGHIPTIVVNADLPPGTRSTTPVDQAGVLRSIETVYGLPYLLEAGSVASGDLGTLLS